MSTLIRELIKNISMQLNKPYVYFGHSLGSRVLFELMKETKLLGYAQPQHFIASGSRGPNEKSMKSPIHNSQFTRC
jgi:surfactin synthase thioesterase subunit